MDGSYPPASSDNPDQPSFVCDIRVPEGALPGFRVVITENAGYCSIAVSHLGNFRVLATVTPDGAVTTMRREPLALDHRQGRGHE
jgi:hypothetical protein